MKWAGMNGSTNKCTTVVCGVVIASENWHISPPSIGEKRQRSWGEHMNPATMNVYKVNRKVRTNLPLTLIWKGQDCGTSQS